MTVGQLLNKIKSDYAVAFQLALQQGSMAPMVDVIQDNRAAIMEKYGVDITSLLGLSPEELEAIKNVEISQLPKQEDGKTYSTSENPIQQVIDENSGVPEKKLLGIHTGWWMLFGAMFGASVVGAYLKFKK